MDSSTASPSKAKQKKIRIVSVNDKTRIECVLHRKRDERTREDVFIVLGGMDDHTITSQDHLESNQGAKNGLDALTDRLMVEEAPRLLDAQYMKI